MPDAAASSPPPANLTSSPLPAAVTSSSTPPAAILSPEPSPDPSPDLSRAASLALLDTLQSTWLPKAQEGDPAAALIVLSILKHRATLLGLAHSPSPALRVAASSSPTSDTTSGEVKLVVEYVNDWREVLRRRT